MVNRKRQHYGQKKKTTLWSNEKDSTMVKRKRQHYGQKKKKNNDLQIIHIRLKIE